MKKISKNLVCEGSVTATAESKKQEKLMEMKKMIDAYLDATSGNETDGTCTCRMCGKHYDNNAYPIVADEKCCDDCNMMVVEMNWWLSINHDILKCRVDNILRNRLTTDFICICFTNVAFTIFKDELTKKLDVVVVCDDERIEKFVEVALLNWIKDKCSDMNLEGVMASPKVGVWKVTNDIKIKEETECGEESVVVTKANEIFERLEKVFKNTDFQVDIDNSMPETNSTIAISRMYDNSYEEILIDFFDMSDYCCANISGRYDDECCCEEGVRWNPENDDVDDVYEDIKNAVSIVYAGITESRIREMFNEE